MESEIERPTHSMSDRPSCDGCGASAPETNTDYTLISRSFGWRLTRRKLPSGALEMQWRCASCWKKYKGDRVIVPSTVTIPPRLEALRSVRPSPKASAGSSYAPPGAKLIGVVK
jgi:hypothetical protein